MSLTGIYDTDLLIVLQLAPEDLLILAQVSKYWSKFCDDELWRSIIRRDFQIDRFIGDPKEQYRYLSTATFRQVREDGRIDGLELYHRKDSVCFWEAEQAIEYGHDEMFWWVIDQGVKVEEGFLEKAISYGREEIFDRLLDLGLNLDEVKIRPGGLWMNLDEMGICPGGLWMILKMIDLGYAPDEQWANWALFSSDFQSLEFLYQRGVVPTVSAFEVSCEFYCLDLLEWAEDHGIVLSAECANEAIQYGQIEILKWLYERNILPSDQTRPSLCWGDLDDLTWLEEHGLGRFDSSHSDHALQIGLLHVVEWLLDREIEPTDEGLEKAAPEAHDWVVRFKRCQLYFWTRSGPI